MLKYPTFVPIFANKFYGSRHLRCRMAIRLLWNVLCPARSASASEVVQLMLRPSRREPRPLALRRDRHARRHIVGDDRAQLAPAARALDDHRVAIGDAARRRIGRVDLDERRAFLGHQARLVGHAAGDKVVRGAGDQDQLRAIASCVL